MVSTSCTLPKLKPPKQKRTASSAAGGAPDVTDKAILKLVEAHTQRAKEPEDPEDLFYKNLAIRAKALPPSIRSYVHLQCSQIFFNAENPNNEQIAVMPLPRPSPESL